MIKSIQKNKNSLKKQQQDSQWIQLVEGYFVCVTILYKQEKVFLKSIQ